MLAVLAVGDKTGVDTLAVGLLDLGWDVVATEGTRRAVAAAGREVGPISELAGVPALLGGRVKALTLPVMAGILARDLEADQAELRAHGITPVDLVCSNVPSVPSGAALELDVLAEAIDIGGPAMLRAAAKNCARVIALTRPRDYPAVLAALRGGDATVASVPLAQRVALAATAFRACADYDAAVGAEIAMATSVSSAG